MDHTKNNVFEAMNAKKEDYDKLLDVIEKTRMENNTLEDFAKAIDKLTIDDKNKHLSYYLANIIDAGAGEAMNMFLTTKAIDLSLMEDAPVKVAQEYVLRFISVFTLAGLTNPKVATAMAVTMSAVLLLAVGPDIQNSIVVETIYNGMIVNKLSCYEMLKGMMTIITILTLEEDPIDRILQ